MRRRSRYLILALMTVLTLCCGLLIPRININEDMTEYLPSDSRMKEGLDSLKRCFPDVDLNAYVIKAMFRENADSALTRELLAFDGVGGIVARQTKDSLELFQLSVEEGTDPKKTAEAIRKAYQDKVVVETNANSNMPDNMVTVLVVAMLLVFGILFLMCSSFVEALLFILTIGMAVVINMGTNAFLPSVSMMTNTIVAVLQFVLSMDYSIILMNRLRQELSLNCNLDDAMSNALRSSSPSILSSSLTTIVGLLALVFMKFKIGLDLGLVLAKGVLCSLISIYTILPSLITIFWKGISATTKKVFLLPTDRLSSFEMKFRVPLAVLFVVIFFSAALLSRRTELSYASIWESEINDEFPPQNLFSLLYRTEDEDKMVPVLDSISTENGVQMVLSYPSIMKKQLSCSDMISEIFSLASLMPGTEPFPVDSTFLNEQTLGILYYAYSHPERNERMSFDDIISLAETASKAGLLPEGIDISSYMKEYQEVPLLEEEPQTPLGDELEPLLEVEPEQSLDYEHGIEDPLIEASVDTLEKKFASADTLVKMETSDSLQIVPEPQDSSAVIQSRFTKENCTTPLTSSEMASFLGFGRKQASMIFSMAAQKGRSARMTPIDFIHYMTGTVLKNKRLRVMIKDSQADQLYACEREMETVLAQTATDSVKVTVVDSILVSDIPVPPAEQLIPEDTAPEPEITLTKPDPMAQLALMYASGEKYSASEVYLALKNAGIKGVDRNTVDLMFLYYGSLSDADSTSTMCIEDMVRYLSDAVCEGGILSSFVPEELSQTVPDLKNAMSEGFSSLKSDKWSMAAVVTDYPLESGETFDFIERSSAVCSSSLGQDFYLVGESVMYKEMKDGFHRELLIVTLLTILSIFLIVLLTFRSIVIPVILILTVLTGVYVNVTVSGIGGRPMLYLAYLIVQSILMGSTIDYGILFTNYYRDFRQNSMSRADALKASYRGSIHTIMTSGMIIVFASYIMSVLLDDPTICSILSSLSYGAVAAIFMILLVLPGVLAACDSLVVRKSKAD